MPTAPKTPGVYIDEIPLFPPSVAEVETAIPAFIGHTAKADRDAAGDLRNVPVKVRSLREFEQYYGVAPKDPIDVEATKGGPNDSFLYNVTNVEINKTLDATDPVRASYLLYYAMQLFFDNGGGECYVVSVGDYATAISDALFTNGLTAIALEDEPTLLVIPDAVKLTTLAGYSSVTTKMLNQCNTLKDRFAILDVWQGYRGPDDQVKDAGAPAGAPPKKVAEASRGAWAGEAKYGAAYYPFLKTTLNYFIGEPKTEDKVTVKVGAVSTVLKNCDPGLYSAVILALREKQFVQLPPSGAIAGVYAATDTKRGVWKAPANVPLADVIEPVVKIDDETQKSLNVDADSGKSINALRSFAGKGTLIWGARTLAGNDNEWRYVPVRRFFNMVEESVKKSTYWAVFEPNDANTWVKVRGMIENYLTQKWREGALAGATTKDAFFVKCGLGTTMTSQDILEGRMFVEIGMAVVRPAEFIILRFYHKLQTS